MKLHWARAAVAAAALAFSIMAGPVAAGERAEPQLKSASVLVLDQDTGEVLLSRNTDNVTPIASLTKLMTALITVEAKLPLDEVIDITDADIDTLKGTGSRLRVGSSFTREDLLKLALMASENRAASALGRSYPGGKSAFVQAMNRKAGELHMGATHFVEPTGLSSSNVSSAEDLAKLVRAAHRMPLIREYSTMAHYDVKVNGRPASFVNTNALVRGGSWDIGLSKTGFINEAGRCLVMQANFNARSVIIVLLDSIGKYTRVADAKRIRQWLEPEFVVAEPKIVRASTKARVAKKSVKRRTVKAKARTSSARVKTTIKAAAR